MDKKAQHNKYNQEYRASHLNQVRAYCREYMREYYQKHKKKIIDNRTARIKERLGSDMEFRKKHYAQRAAQKAKILMVECIKCGSKEQLQRHHLNYDKPLEVVILCQPCHREEHNKKANEAIL